jgi:hypothetical protein
VDTLKHFHGLGLVFYTRIGPNIEGLTADKLAELAIGSAVAVRGGELEKGTDGVSYLIAAKKNGIVTPLMPTYEQQIKSKTGTQSLEEALRKLTA